MISRAAFIALVGLAASYAPLPARAAAGIAFPDCIGRPLERPASIMLACGDGSFSAQGLTWTGWGGSFAAARGTASVNDCTPDCADGHYHQRPIVLIADGRSRCPDGRPAYARLTVAWPAPVEKSDVLELSRPCGHR